MNSGPLATTAFPRVSATQNLQGSGMDRQTKMRKDSECAAHDARTNRHVAEMLQNAKSRPLGAACYSLVI